MVLEITIMETRLQYRERRREIERMLLAGKKLTVPKLMELFGVGRDAIRRDFDIINETLPIVVKRGYGGGYSLLEGPGMYQNLLSQEQLKCLKALKMICTEEQKENVQSILQEFGPYEDTCTVLD